VKTGKVSHQRNTYLYLLMFAGCGTMTTGLNDLDVPRHCQGHQKSSDEYIRAVSGRVSA